MSTDVLDIPFQNTPGSSIYPWLTGGFIYIAVIVLAIAAVSNAIIGHFKTQPTVMTIALPPVAPTPENTLKTDKIADLLRGLEGVVFVNNVDSLAENKLIGPSSGEADVALAMPRLMDIGLSNGTTLDLQIIDDELRALTRGLALGDAVAPGAEIMPLAQASRSLGLGVGAASLIAILAMTGIAMAIGIGRHVHAIGLLRQMGASDGYIARQFEHFALLRGLKGAFVGFVLAAATMSAALFIFQLTDTTVITGLGLRAIDWVVLALVPTCIALLIAPTARFSAYWRLRRLEA